MLFHVNLELQNEGATVKCNYQVISTIAKQLFCSLI
jgi:hypothetical protein